MKREYVTPRMICEAFVADEYVAACGDSGTVYNFECNAGDLNLPWYDYPYKVYVDYHGNGNYGYRAKYHACGATHEAKTDSEFFKGYMDDIRTPGNDNIQVIVWTGKDGKNTHCTTNLDMSTWETAKS